MTIKNTGKRSEVLFEKWVTSHGKTSVMYRFKDSSDFTSANKKGALMATNNPADYAGVLMGTPCFVEVKSSVNKTSFPISNVQKPFQRQAGTRITKAGGSYYYFIHRLSINEAYLIEFNQFWELPDTKWDTLRKNADIILGSEHGPASNW